MGLELNDIPGQTPLDEEETEGLLIPSVSTREELNEFEQQNIERAIFWVLKRSFKLQLILTESFIKEVHKRMYGDVWRWAGEFRKTEKNIGVEKWKIGTELKYLLDDSIHWAANKVYEPDELAVRFKHRLVSIHCFSNGNGRHSRLMADILIEKIFKRPAFTWGAATQSHKDIRKNYLTAVKTADAGSMEALLIFARS